MKHENSFSQRVYDAVRRIPPGRVATYGQIAFLCGSPRASRAVGWALHRNPAPWCAGKAGEIEPVPCHRVVNRQGRLAPEFAFGGPQEQKLLLLAEGIRFDADGKIDLTVFGWRPAQG